MCLFDMKKKILAFIYAPFSSATKMIINEYQTFRSTWRYGGKKIRKYLV